jgi:hypothetical protein
MGLTFSQARLLLRLISAPGASLLIDVRDNGNGDPSRGPTFHGFFCHRPCSACGHRVREAASWRVIHALAEGGHIVSAWGDSYGSVTDVGHAAAEEAKARWPNMVIPRQPN